MSLSQFTETLKYAEAGIPNHKFPYLFTVCDEYITIRLVEKEKRKKKKKLE